MKANETNIEIDKSDLGLPPERCFIIGEVAQAHDGSLGSAHAYIDAIAEAGADAVKFQTHIAAAESTLDEPWRVRFSPQDTSRYDYWRRMEFSEIQWAGLAAHAADKGLLFMSSPFSTAAVELLDRIGMKLWKIASGEIYNPELLAAVWATGRPVLYSSGMSTIDELDGVIQQTRSRRIPFGLFQCSSSYPCPPSQWGLSALAQLRCRFACPTGFSDHSGGIYAGLAAATLGADFLEVHVTFSKRMFGPDVPASVTVDELRQLVTGVRSISAALSAAADKDALAAQTAELKTIFGRSVALRRDLPAGTLIEDAHLTLKKPAGGIPPERRHELVGRRLRHDKPADRLLEMGDFE